MFEVCSENFGRFKKKKLVNTTSGESVSVIPGRGGNVAEVVLSCGQRQFSVIDGFTTYDELLKNDYHKSAKLLPFANRISDGIYRFNGKTYQLPINRPQEHYAIHGFIHDKEFIVDDEIIKPDSVTLILAHEYSGDYPGYPFPFEVRLEFSLHGQNGFTFITEVKNRGEEIMPVMDGWHPYFTLGKSIDRLLLKIPANIRTEVDERLLPTGKLMPFPAFREFEQIGNYFFDTCFPLSEKEGTAVTELMDPQEMVTLQVWQKTGRRKYNFLQLYTPPHGQSIAFEPMTSNTNSFNTKDRLIVLSPGEKLRAECGIKLKNGE